MHFMSTHTYICVPLSGYLTSSTFYDWYLHTKQSNMVLTVILYRCFVDSTLIRLNSLNTS